MGQWITIAKYKFKKEYEVFPTFTYDSNKNYQLVGISSDVNEKNIHNYNSTLFYNFLYNSDNIKDTEDKYNKSLIDRFFDRKDLELPFLTNDKKESVIEKEENEEIIFELEKLLEGITNDRINNEDPDHILRYATNLVETMVVGNNKPRAIEFFVEPKWFRVYDEFVGDNIIRTIRYYEPSSINALPNRISFKMCKGLIKVYELECRNLTNAKDMFNGCISLEKVCNIDVSKVKNMQSMFKDCINLKTIDKIEDWNVSNVIEAANLFENCKSLLNLDLSKWNVANIKNMSSAFKGCFLLKNINVNNWKLNNIEKLEYTFSELPIEIIDIRNWITNSIISVKGMFKGCDRLKEAYLPRSWGSNLINMSYLFADCVALRKLSIDNDHLIVPASVKNIEHMFDNCCSLVELTTVRWDLRNIISIKALFANCSSLRKIKTTSKATGDNNLTIWKMPNLEDASYMFFNCIELGLDGNININWDNTPKLMNSSYLFKNCYNLTSINLNKWKTGNLIKIMGMFDSCVSLENLYIDAWSIKNSITISIPYKKIVNKNGNLIEEEDTKDIKINFDNMSSLFNNCKSLKNITLPTIDSQNVEDISYLFNNCESLIKINGTTRLNVQNVKNMCSSFRNCKNLLELDLTGWNTSKVNKMDRTFNHCETLTRIINISKLNVQNVMTMESLFEGCYKLKELDLTGWNTSKVENIDNIFKFCLALNNIQLFTNISKIKSMLGVFYNCISLKTINLKWNTSLVNNMSYAFRHCEALENIIFEDNFDTKNVKTFEYTFHGCKKLKLNIETVSSWKFDSLNNMVGTFRDCKELYGRINGKKYWGNVNIKHFNDCFANCDPEKLENYNLIPAAWGQII